MAYWVRVLPREVDMVARDGDNLLQLLRDAGLAVSAPCGGEGRCGKCRVRVDGTEVLACQTTVDRDMVVTLPEDTAQRILTEGTLAPIASAREGYQLAFDIGTTTVAGWLLAGGRVLARASAANPQASFGADVITRIRHGVRGQLAPMTASIRDCLDELTRRLCRGGGISPDQVKLVSVVGNPAMQQILLGLPLDNLAAVPFAPVLTAAKTIPAGDILPLWDGAELLIVPDIAGFVGADTVACILAAGMDTAEELTLLVDIGTNGEMVLGNRRRMAACSAAAGPALEGAGITCGMSGRDGAIDHVKLENGQLVCTVIGGGTAAGICGSGLIDAVAAALDAGWLNQRGKILTKDGLIHLTAELSLTQEDIRQVQLVKGAIAAGIELMAAHLGVALEDIDTVYLAGAFGTYMDPRSACRMGLLPPVLEGKIRAIGNAAGSGAKWLACSPGGLERASRIVEEVEALELSALPGFARCFARNMRF